MNTADLLLLARTNARCKSGEARQIRDRSGLTLQQVADHCKVSVPAVHLWERGLRTPRGAPALRYGRLLDALAEQQAAMAPTEVSA